MSSVVDGLCRGRRAGAEKTPGEARCQCNRRCWPVSSPTRTAPATAPGCSAGCSVSLTENHISEWTWVGTPFSFNHSFIHKVTLLMVSAAGTLHAELCDALPDVHVWPWPPSPCPDMAQTSVSFLGPSHQKYQELLKDIPVSYCFFPSLSAQGQEKAVQPIFLLLTWAVK